MVTYDVYKKARTGFWNQRRHQHCFPGLISLSWLCGKWISNQCQRRSGLLLLLFNASGLFQAGACIRHQNRLLSRYEFLFTQIFPNRYKARKWNHLPGCMKIHWARHTRYFRKPVTTAMSLIWDEARLKEMDYGFKRFFPTCAKRVNWRIQTDDGRGLI